MLGLLNTIGNRVGRSFCYDMKNHHHLYAEIRWPILRMSYCMRTAQTAMQYESVEIYWKTSRDNIRGYTRVRTYEIRGYSPLVRLQINLTLICKVLAETLAYA